MLGAISDFGERVAIEKKQSARRGFRLRSVDGRLQQAGDVGIVSTLPNSY
jgi:hypothetical protein